MRNFFTLLRYEMRLQTQQPLVMLMPAVLLGFLLAAASYASQGEGLSRLAVIILSWVTMVLALQPACKHNAANVHAQMVMLYTQPVGIAALVLSRVMSLWLTQGLLLVLMACGALLLFYATPLHSVPMIAAVFLLGMLLCVLLNVTLEYIRGFHAQRDNIVLIVGLPLYFPIILFVVTGVDAAMSASPVISAQDIIVMLCGLLLLLTPLSLLLARVALRTALEE